MSAILEEKPCSLEYRTVCQLKEKYAHRKEVHSFLEGSKDWLSLQLVRILNII